MSNEALRQSPDAGASALALAAQYARDDVREAAVQKNAQAVQAWEKNTARADQGRREHWEREDLDDCGWGTIALPGDFAANLELAGFCGTIWLRRRFTLPPAFAARAAKLWLSTIVDADTVFINGREVGRTGYRYPPRKYPVPEGVLREGENQITIRVVCNQGSGGVTPDKPFGLFLEPRHSGPAAALSGVWHYKTGGTSPRREDEFFIQWQPTGLYNAMIHPVLRYAVQGVIWYQGESNDKNSEQYETLFTAMIQDLREKKAAPRLPFLFVQLPLWGKGEASGAESAWAALREAQQNALRLPATGMAAALDLGEWNDLHPLNKKGVGFRLALAAEAVVDGEAALSPGAVLRDIKHERGALVLNFDKCGEGLFASGAVTLGIADAAGKLYHRSAAITGRDTLRVAIAGIENPRTLFYAWADNPLDANLYNSGGLPALPFRRSIEEAQ
jgi:sialate O-acetylesterase